MPQILTARLSGHLKRHAAKRGAGLSLVELLVGLAIGLLAMLVVLQVAVLFDARRRETVAGSDAQINGAQVLMAIERDLKRAGYGLGPASAQACVVKRYFNTTQPDLVLQAVTITDGVNGRPDSLRILASTALEASVATTLVNPHAADATLMMVNSTLGMATGDLLVLHEAGKPCALIQASAVPAGDFRVHHAGAANTWNPDSPATLFPSGGYGTDTAVINVGALLDHLYRVNQNNQVTLRRHLSSSNTNPEAELATGIVNLQAQYGFDTRPGNQAIPQVDQWHSTVIDADGDNVVGNSGDLQRIYAIRFAIVARSTYRSTTCATPAAPVWLAGDASGQLVGTVITVNPDTNGLCSRFQVFQSVVPLRNRFWGET